MGERAEFERLKAELDKARHEIETLRGKTGSCPQCEVLTAERDKAKTDLAKATGYMVVLEHKHCEALKAGNALQESVRTFLNSYGVAEYHARQAMCDSALAWREAAGKERSDGE